ncbi:Putative tetratricopeptide-like helical domain superfamily, malT-like TPR region [Colletotrichum destructivum]|uniref:Tetratricopeptide-like helical domain superfamily, malT-like TPR region n=1 Tax=Colletotrichum destructivum TaxID=34406 RepID=A0AAX4IH13_9PEZI|nr:Putative tetratricopeptide-like helical domain superfamily, malT-like TPR region [Colletotrichum destructivum]
MDRQTHFGSTTGHVAFPGAHVETGGTLNVTVSDTRPTPTTARPSFVFPFEQNKDFIDRPDVVASLDALLPPVDEYQSAALWGLGGSGKTQIALEFAYSRFHQTNCAVYWVHADNEATFTQDYEALARKAGLDKKGKDLLHAVRGWIEAQPRWLLVVDNADDISIFGVGSDSGSTRDNGNPTEETCLYDYIPRGPVGTVLWTTRDERLVGSLVGVRQGLQVGRMTAGEATALFESTRGNDVLNDEKDSVSELLTKLDYLPLAVSQAAAYIRRLSVPIAQYLSRLDEVKKRWKILQKSEHDRHRRPAVPNSILQTWSISMDHLKKKDHTAYNLLLTLAYVHNENIPESFIHAAARSCRANIGQSTSSPTSPTESDDESDDDDDAAATAVVRLREFSFLSARKPQETGQTYEMHGLVQDAARYALSRKTRREEAARFSKIALLLISDLFPSNPKETWEEYELWLPHALQSSEWAEVCEADANQEIAALLMKVNDYLLNRGRYNEMLAITRKAYLFGRASLGVTHPITLLNMNKLAELYAIQKRYEDAEEVALEAVELTQQAFGMRHRTTLTAMTRLAAFLKNGNKLDDAEKILTEVLKPRTLLQSLEEISLDTAQFQAMVQLALVYHRQGKYNVAEQIQIKLLRFQEDFLGKKDLETMSTMARLAKTYSSQGKYPEAETIMAEVLELEIEINGKMNIGTIFTMLQLAQTYNAQGKHEDAEHLLVEALKLREDISGKKHQGNIWLKSILSEAYTAQGKHNDAEHHLLEALKLQEDIFGKNDKNYLALRFALSATCTAQGKHNDAERHLVEALKLHEDIFGKNDKNYLALRFALSATCTAQGKHNDAERHTVEALKLYGDLFGKWEPTTTQTIVDLTRADQAQETVDGDDENRQR